MIKDDNMNRERGFIVEGYQFFTQEEAKKAAQELAKIKILDEKLDETNTDMVLSLYKKAREQQTFETEIGLAYLRNLQIYLIGEKVISPEELPLPVYYSKHNWEKESVRIKEEYRAEEEEISKKAEEQVNKAKEAARKAKDKSRFYVVTICVLIFMVIGMFLITLTGNNENILNYKTVITNRYAEWEQELTEREAAIREKEAKLQSEE